MHQKNVSELLKELSGVVTILNVIQHVLFILIII